MTTKEQEKKALEQITKIIDGLGTGSYLEMTFSGILEQAADNIENDFGSNYKEMYETALDAIGKKNSDAAETQKTIEELRAYNRTLSDQNDTKSDRIDQLNKELHDACDMISEYIDKQYEDKKKIETLESEIITLKAKLYDLMTV